MKCRTTILYMALSLVLYGSPCGVAGEELVVPNNAVYENDIENVFIVVIDGLRNSEAFDDPSHQYIPHIWNDLRPLGTVYSNFFNIGRTSTTAGHAAMTAGSTQILINTAIGDTLRKLIQEEPSIFQNYRFQKGVPKDKTWIVNGKSNALKLVGISLNPFFTNTFKPSVSNHNPNTDFATWEELRTIIDTYHPSLTLVNFKQVDHGGHSGDWDHYTGRILEVDAIIYDLFQKVWQDPVYAGNTVIIITSDHGRHLDGIWNGFVGHGDSCLGCREVPFLAIGPNIKVNAEVTNMSYLRDIAPTVAFMLGFEVPFSEGRILSKMFDIAVPPETVSQRNPAAACGGGKLHVAFCKFHERKYEVIYKNSQDNGQTWSETTTLSVTANNLFPSITASGDRVAVAWSSLHSDGSWQVALRESQNGGAQWSDTICTGLYHVYSRPAVRYYEDMLHLVWDRPEKPSKSSKISLAFIQDSTIIEISSFSAEEYFMRPRCAQSAAGTHVVFQQFDAEGQDWEIGYSFHDGSTWSNTLLLDETDGESLRPDIVADGTGIHVVWGERYNDLFKIVARNSLTGTFWDNTVVIGESPSGAWRPRIASAGHSLNVVWEAYDNEIPAVFGSKSTDGGSSWSPAVKLSDSAGTEAMLPSIAINHQNHACVFWVKGWRPSKIDFIVDQL